MNPPLVRKMGSAARDKAEKEFAVEKVLDSHLQLFNVILNRHSLNS